MAGVWVAGMGRSTGVFLQLEHFFFYFIVDSYPGDRNNFSMGPIGFTVMPGKNSETHHCK